MKSEGYPVEVMQAYAGKERNEFTLMDFVETETPTVVWGGVFSQWHLYYERDRAIRPACGGFLILKI